MRKIESILKPSYSAVSSLPRVSESSLIAERFNDFISDESKLQGDLPLSLSLPTNLEGVVSVLRENFLRNENTTISGARSGVVGGAVPIGRTHLLSMEKLTGIGEVQFDGDGRPFLTALAGTKLSAINSYLSENYPDLFYPVDPTYQHSAIGGNVSTNAGGARSYFYGSTRKWIRGLKIVLADGGVLKFVRGELQAVNGVLELESESGRRVLSGEKIRVPETKHAIGYHYNKSVDLVDIMVGAEGTLAAVVEVDIYLTSRPKHRLYFTQFFQSIDQAFAFATDVKKLGISILALEFIDQNSIAIVKDCAARKTCRTIQAIDSSYQAAVFLDTMFEQTEELENVYNKLESLLSGLGVDSNLSIAGTEAKDLEDFKVFRHAVPENINALVAERKRNIPELLKISTDMSVNPIYLREIYDFYTKTLTEHDLQHFIFGHFGDSHLHLNVVPKSLEQLNLFHSLYPSFAKKVVECGGAVAGEHGIGRVKKQFLKIQYNSEELRTLKEIKSFFDPGWLLNPGILIDSQSSTDDF